MSSKSPRDIQWHVAPLAIYTKTGLASVSGPGTKLLPSKYKAVCCIQHWAIQVEEKVYEVTSVYVRNGSESTKVFCLNIIETASWWELRRACNANVDTKKVGQTFYTNEELAREANLIWKTYHGGRYHVHDRNCQNFASLFTQGILAPRTDGRISLTELLTWHKMPSPVSYMLATVAQAGLIAGAVETTKAVLGGHAAAAGSSAVGAHATAVTTLATAHVAAHSTILGVSTGHVAAIGTGAMHVGGTLSWLDPTGAAIGIFAGGAALVAIANKGKRKDRKWKEQRQRDEIAEAAQQSQAYSYGARYRPQYVSADDNPPPRSVSKSAKTQTSELTLKQRFDASLNRLDDRIASWQWNPATATGKNRIDQKLSALDEKCEAWGQKIRLKFRSRNET